MLLQAKTSLKPKTGSLNSGTQRIQFELYQSWPAFTGETRLATSPAGYSSWDFTHPSAGSEPCTAGAEYAIIYKKHAYRSVLTTPRWKGDCRLARIMRLYSRTHFRLNRRGLLAHAPPACACKRMRSVPYGFCMHSVRPASWNGRKII